MHVLTSKRQRCRPSVGLLLRLWLDVSVCECVKQKLEINQKQQSVCIGRKRSRELGGWN